MRPFEKRYTTIAYLFIDAQSNTLSLSRFQLIMWTAAAVVACSYVAASQSLVQWTWQLPTIPEGLAPLLGLSVGTTALAIGATESRGGKGAGPAHPGLGDVITSGGVLAPDRLQFFLWTILGAVGFVGATLAQDPATVTNPPKIPENFLPLMGISSLGYLAGKVARKPGPVIRQLAPLPPFTAASVTPAGILPRRRRNTSCRICFGALSYNERHAAEASLRRVLTLKHALISTFEVIVVERALTRSRKTSCQSSPRGRAIATEGSPASSSRSLP